MIVKILLVLLVAALAAGCIGITIFMRSLKQYSDNRGVR